MLTELQQPGYLHVLINHVPIIGTFMGLVGLLVGLFLRQRIALIPALAILVLAGISAWPVYATGDAAYKPIRKIADEAGADWLDEHMDRADRTVWTFYAMAGVAAAAMAVPLRWPKSATPFTLVAAVLAVACVGAGAYIAQPGGRIRHVEFRPPDSVPPSPESSTHHEH
jgi:hypothetical protein